MVGAAAREEGAMITVVALIGSDDPINRLSADEATNSFHRGRG